jgi:carbamoyltransferase
MTYDHWDRDALLGVYEDGGGLIARFKQPLKGTFLDSIYQRGKAQGRASLLGELGFSNGRLAAVDHHMAHAAAAFYGSGFKGKVLVLTCDGGGDRLSATVAIGERGLCS